ncbi:hypothetical protein BDV93DRAFT_556100 [Ceratobasidium sp. AG-I]|nr:hypothetical protein BDV93DRAFT_556100 [Ceratobasidium sp. AG-I]
MSAIHVFPLTNRPKQTRPGRRKKVTPGASNTTTAGRRSEGSGSSSHPTQDSEGGLSGAASPVQDFSARSPSETGPVRRTRRIRQSRVNAQSRLDPGGYYGWLNEQTSPASTDSNFPATPHFSTSPTPSASSSIHTRRNAMSGSPHGITFSDYGNVIPPTTNNIGGLATAHSWPSTDPSPHFGQRHEVHAWQEGAGNEVAFSSHLPLDNPFHSHSNVSHTVSDSDLLPNIFYNNRLNPTFVQHAIIPSHPQITQHPRLGPPQQAIPSEFAPTTSSTIESWNTEGWGLVQQPPSSYPQAIRCFSGYDPSYPNNPASTSSDLESPPYLWPSQIVADPSSAIAPVAQGNELSLGELGFDGYGQLQYDVTLTPYTPLEPNIFAPPNQ